MYIKIRFQEDDLFGPDAENRAGVDGRASVKNYVETLTQKLQAEYSQAEIDVAEGLGRALTVSDEDDAEYPYIENIIHNHWMSWDWVVKN